MQIHELPLDKEITQQIQDIETFSTLNPPQELAVNSGLFDRKNMIIAIPTASGKTFLAELCAIQHILELKGKVIYLSPLKALASEKYNDFKRFRSLGIKIGITLGDYDSADKIDSYDFLVSTNEKIDSLLRHKRSFVNNISLVIIDECHLIDDGTRGPTLEALIVKLRILNPSIQLLALSATISNSYELANWLNATLVKSNWRSVPLKEFYCLKDGLVVKRDQEQDTGTSFTRSINMVGNSVLLGLVKEVLDDKGQVLIFTNSRKRTQSISITIKELSRNYLSTNQHEELVATVSKLKNDASLRDKTSIALFDYICHGVAFHHAGLNTTQRRAIEHLFKKGLIKVIVATPTLAAGINLPARRVIISNIWRFSSHSGRMNPIKVMEYEQMRGRAGRPRYDTFGEAFILAGSDRDEEIILSKFYSTDALENIESKLALRPVLRIHILGAIATGIVSTYAEVKSFLNQSFYAHVFQDFTRLENILNQVLNDLESFNFILLENEAILITRLGSRVSQLYIDPVTATILLTGLLELLRIKPLKVISFLHLYCLVPDISRIRMSKQDWGIIDSNYNVHKDSLIDLETFENLAVWKNSSQLNYDAYKTALILEDWINEVSLAVIYEKFGLSPGDFQRLHDLMKWISYSARELIKELIHIRKNYYDQFLLFFSDESITLKRLEKLYRLVSQFEIRISEGIKADLLELIELKGLGRVKARILSRNGIRSKQDLINTQVDKLIQIKGFGPQLITSLMQQLGKKINFADSHVHESILNKKFVEKKNKPKTLFDYLKQKDSYL